MKPDAIVKCASCGQDRWEVHDPVKPEMVSRGTAALDQFYPDIEACDPEEIAEAVLRAALESPSTGLDARDDLTEARLLERLERDGLLRTGLTATEARAILDA